MPWLALALYAVYLTTAFLLRTELHHRRTGSTGFHGISGRPGSAKWFGGVLFILALNLGVAAPIFDMTGDLQPIGAPDGWLGHLLGATRAIDGIILTLLSQGAMGTSWRIGVDPNERTTLVTSGLFGVVRNPVFSAMVLTGTGLTLLVPNIVALIGLATLVTAIELQTRAVEEPHLLRAHGDTYAQYAVSVAGSSPGSGGCAPRRRVPPARRSPGKRPRTPGTEPSRGAASRLASAVGVLDARRPRPGRGVCALPRIAAPRMPGDERAAEPDGQDSDQPDEDGVAGSPATAVVGAKSRGAHQPTLECLPLAIAHVPPAGSHHPAPVAGVAHHPLPLPGVHHRAPVTVVRSLGSHHALVAHHPTVRALT